MREHRQRELTPVKMRRFWQRDRMKGVNPWVALAYGLLVAFFIYTFAQFYLPEKGFSYLISFGGKQDQKRVTALNGLEYYVQEGIDGYDAQYYVQIAMDPTLRNPELKQAVDSLPYRARRILISAVSYVMGFGQPAAILQAFALQNAIAWLGLAGVLLWWFPPVDWSRFFRWAGVLFSFGVCTSLRNSLVDGPSLLLIAVGVLAVEKNRRWLATFIFALGGLGKETNLFGAISLASPATVRSPRLWPGLLFKAVLVALPLVLWALYIDHYVGRAVDMGARNFAWPFVAYAHKWVEVIAGLNNPQSWTLGWVNCEPLWSLLSVVALTVQFLWLVLRPEPTKAWWRVGMSFAVLMLVLGDAVWEGFPGAATRVLLPMQLAFNVLVPFGRAWWPVLILGNLTLLSAPIALKAPLGDGYKFSGPSEILTSTEGELLRLHFGRAWHQTEQLKDRYWRWSRSSSTVTINNPHPFALESNWSFLLAALDERSLEIQDDAKNVIWSGSIGDRNTPVEIGPLLLKPGSTVFRFITAEPPLGADNDPRKFAFCVKNLLIQVTPAALEGAVLTGSKTALVGAEGKLAKVSFLEGWYPPERQGERIWRWTQGAAQWSIFNPQAYPVKMKVSFALNGVNERRLELRRGDGTMLWSGTASDRRSAKANLDEIVLQPGENSFVFKSNQAAGEVPGDLRLLDFCVRDLSVELSR